MGTTPFSLKCGLGLLLALGSAFAGDLKEISPIGSYSVPQNMGLENGALKIREFRSAGNGLWILLQDIAKPGHVLVRADLAGVSQPVVALTPDKRPIALAATSRGVATIQSSKDRAANLVEYSAEGKELFRASLGCYLAEGLLSLDGRPATICPDGRITRYEQTGTTMQYSSWSRPGALSVFLGAGILAVVDRGTARIVLNDLKTNQVSSVSSDVPEIIQALNANASNVQAANASALPGDPPLGTPLVVMDAASDGGALYLLIWPYHPSAGPAVVKLSHSGNVLARYRCRGTNDKSLHKIALADGGNLWLASVNGRIYHYRIQ